jgi:hypothetical protein
MEKRSALDNQQERLVSLDYVAGLITGEGCFCFNIVRNKGRGLINPVFQMFMCDKDTIDVTWATLQHFGLPGYYQERPKHAVRNQYGLRVHGVKRLKRYCETFVPRLTGDKRRAAEIVGEFCNYRLSLHPKAGYSPVDVEYVRQLREVNGNSKVNRTSLEDLPRILRDYMPNVAQ